MIVRKRLHVEGLFDVRQKVLENDERYMKDQMK